MGNRTWAFELKRNGSVVKVIQCKMQKSLAKSLTSMIAKPLNIEHHERELSGIIGCEERTSNYQIMFGTVDAIRSPETYDENLHKYLNSFPDVFTEENYKPIIELRDEFVEKHISIKDSRRTQDEDNKRNTELNEIAVKREAEAKIKAENKKTENERLIIEFPYLETIHNTKKSRHALASSNIKRQLQMKYPGAKFSVKSDSFSMGDSVHISWTDGPTEKEASDIYDPYQYGHFNGMIDMYEYTEDNNWTIFGSSKYISGNRHLTKEAYLKASEATEIKITFDKWDGMDRNIMSQDQIRRIRIWLCDNSLYVKPKVDPKSETSTTHKEVGVSRNEEKGGIEISFNGKPAISILDQLKSNGWRWSRFGKVWWKKFTDADWQFANNLIGG